MVKLNSDMQYDIPMPTISGENFVADMWHATAKKHGRIVTLYFNVRGTVVQTNDFITLFTLDSQYRPSSTIYFNYITQNGKVMVMIINTVGTVMLLARETIPQSNFLIRQCITFISAT